MIKNYLKTAWRNTANSRTYSTINILGLAAGLASFMVILLYLNYEFSFDQWDPELKQVYRVSMRQKDDYLSTTPAPLSAFLAQKYTNAAAATSLESAGDFEILLSANGKKIYQKNVVTADSFFFKVFPYKMVKGNALNALTQPKAVVLSEELSHKLFGDADPIGQPVKIFNAITAVVTGVMQEPKGPSQLTAKMVMLDQYFKQNSFWENYSYQTYIKLKRPAPDAQVEDAINKVFYNDHLKKDNKSYAFYKTHGQQTALFVDQVTNIHNFPKHGDSNIATVSVLLALAVLLLLAGAINFSNLTIAKAIRRAKEVGVRKVLGSSRGQLVAQFMTETALQCLMSMGVALLVVYLALPYINNSFNIHLNYLYQDNSLWLAAQIALCLVLIILFSGFYPSVLLSRFNNSKVLKGDYSAGKQGVLFRNGLMVVQFMVSVFFIIAVLVINKQLDYMQVKDKGFSGDQVMRITTTQPTRENGFDHAANTLLAVPGVSYVSKATKVPGDYTLTDTSTFSFKHNGKPYRMSSVKISKDYFKTLQVALVKGRYFTDAFADQNTRTAVINESAAQLLNLPNAIGQTITFPMCDSVPLQIVGVVKDFHVGGFERKVQPEVYTIGNKACMFQSGGAILVKINTSHISQSVAAIDQAWKKLEPDFPLRYSFINENFQQLFASYTRLQTIISFFAAVAVTISVMGLFAMAAFFMKQRTKEIGVRKVLGASVAQLATLLSKEFVYLVLLSIVLIIPVAWWLMQKWLQTFAYRVSIGGWVFFAGAAIAMLIAVITISFHSIKAALANPVNSLRNE
jgi:putative ABC transport system permease protein